MFRGLLKVLFAGLAVAAVRGAEAPAEVYLNRTVTTNAMVNARHFVNEGEFRASGSKAWDAQNVLTFTNRALMFGGPGFRFEHVDPVFGFRTPAQVFYNSPNGVIQGADSGLTVTIGPGGFGGGGGGGFNLGTVSSMLKVNALNITNRGVMAVGANGLIQMYGGNVDLTAGALIVGDLFDPLSSGGGGGGFPLRDTNQFNPGPGIYDLGAGISFYTNASAGSVIGGVNPTSITTLSPDPIITNFFGFAGQAPLLLDNAMTWVRQEVIDETNEVIQVIAVQTADTNLGVFATFTPQIFYGAPVGDFLTAAVEFRVGTTDFATLARVTNSLYVLDQLGAHTNRDLMVNLRDGTFRPGNFVVFRGGPDQYGGEPASTNIREDIFTVHVATQGTNEIETDYLNTTLSNEWSIYSFQLASSPTRLPNIPGISFTNLGGQVEIHADQLKLQNTRIRGEGYVSLVASNVVGGQNVVVDVPRLTADFSTRGQLITLDDFTPDRVERFSGYVKAYSSIFTNGYEVIVTNPPTDPTATNDTIVTNIIEVRFQLTLIDARDLQTTEETLVQDLRLTSVNGRGAVVYNEDMNITNYVQIRANEFTVSEGSRLYAGEDVGFSYTNLFDISYFTNLGTIQVNELADLRKSENQPLEQFVNRGDFLAYGADIWARYFENTGTIASSNFFLVNAGEDIFGVPSVFTQSYVTPGNINIRAETMRIDSGLFFTQGDIRFAGDVLKLSNWEAIAGARLVFDVSQTITDTGTAGTNSILVFGGIEMSPKAPRGDLLGTTIIAQSSTLEFYDIIWSADDRGASPDGFVDNLAIGRLVLSGGNGSVFQMVPPRANGAMYVDVLQIDGFHAGSISNLTNGLILGMNVYFADLVSTNPAITASAVNAAFANSPFKLVWVPSFQGPNSSVDVPLSATGPVARMNRGLRESLTIDSDGDGIPNGRDSFPMTANAGGATDVQLVGVNRNAAQGSVSFNIMGPQTATYVIERTASLEEPNWQAVTGTLTSDPQTSLKTFTDRIDQASSQGYYRVRITP